jgi:uncharacterized protein (TIGR02598 family)
MKTSFPPSRPNRAFSLVEVTLTLGIAAFCLLALFGLLPIGLNSNRASVTQSGAANIATALAADLRGTPLPTQTNANPTSPQYKISIPATGSAPIQTIFFRTNGNPAGKVGAAADPTQDPFYRAMLEIGKEPTSNGTATKVHVLVTWPALGDRTANTAPKNFSGSFETVIFLNRS